jgi:hypothetical protein
MLACITKDSFSLFPFRLSRQVIQQASDAELYLLHDHINWEVLKAMSDSRDWVDERAEFLQFCEACFCHAPLLTCFIEHEVLDKIIDSLVDAEFLSKSCAIRALVAAVNTGTQREVVFLFDRGVLFWFLQMLGSHLVESDDERRLYWMAIGKLWDAVCAVNKTMEFADAFITAEGKEVLSKLDDISASMPWTCDLMKILDRH